MNYAQMRKYDSSNGSGIGATIFLSGCKHNCPGCFNSLYFDEDYGTLLDDKAIDTFIGYLKNPHVNHSAILGGEPLLMPTGPEDLEHFLKRVKEEVPGKSMWMWTGYTLNDLQVSSDYLDKIRLRLINDYVDYLIDGKYVKALYSNRIIFRGSTNQIIWKKNESGIFEECKELNNFRL